MSRTKKQNAPSDDLKRGLRVAAATSIYAALAVREVLEAGVSVFRICFGRQLLASALGANTVKMHHGHRNANHPVRDLAAGRISVVSVNRGFAVDRETLSADVAETHVSLFDGSNCGIRSERFPAFRYSSTRRRVPVRRTVSVCSTGFLP